MVDIQSPTAEIRRGKKDRRRRRRQKPHRAAIIKWPVFLHDHVDINVTDVGHDNVKQPDNYKYKPTGP